MSLYDYQHGLKYDYLPLQMLRKLHDSVDTVMITYMIKRQEHLDLDDEYS